MHARTIETLTASTTSQSRFGGVAEVEDVREVGVGVGGAWPRGGVE